MKKRFIRFLKGRGIYEKFVGCLVLYPNVITAKDLDDLFEKVSNPLDWVTRGIGWGRTDDGREYWEYIEKEWWDIVDAEKEKAGTFILKYKGVKWSKETIKSMIDELTN